MLRGARRKEPPEGRRGAGAGGQASTSPARTPDAAGDSASPWCDRVTHGTPSPSVSGRQVSQAAEKNVTHETEKRADVKPNSRVQTVCETPSKSERLLGLHSPQDEDEAACKARFIPRSGWQ